MKTFIFSFFLLFFFSITPSFSQSETSSDKKGKKQSIFSYLSEKGIEEIKLEANLKELIEKKNTDEYIPAKISYKIGKKEWESWDIEVRCRGKYRRRICDFPPIKLEFSKKDLEAKGLKKIDDLKLVTHCFDNLESRDIVLREFLTYQLFNKLTDNSFRVHLLKITYCDSSKTYKKTKQYGFLIEDKDELAKRLDADICDDCYGRKKEELNLEQAKRVALLQYMVGNGDWNIAAQRNAEFLLPEDSTEYLIVPFDFDFSGLVNAHYAIPSTELGQESIRERVFIGIQYTEEEFMPTLRYFMAQKENILNYCENFRLLQYASRKDITDYLNTFFDSLNYEAIVGMGKKE